MPDELLRVREFCNRYAISRATFYRLVQRKELPICKIGTATRVRSADAEAWMSRLRP